MLKMKVPVDECIFASCFMLLFCTCRDRILVFYGVCTHLLCLFSPGSGQMMDTMDIVLGPVVLERKGEKIAKIAYWGNNNNTRRKPTPVRDSREFNDQLYDGNIFPGHIVALGSAASNSFAPCNWIGETTYKNRRNLTSGRDLEGELACWGSIFNLRRS